MKKELKLIGIILTIVILIYALGKIYIKHERFTDLYIEMQEINNNQSLIGLSKEQVIVLLGEPMKRHGDEYRYGDEYNWRYDAGTIYEGLILGNHNIWTESKWYVLCIAFDETDKVKSTVVEYFP